VIIPYRVTQGIACTDHTNLHTVPELQTEIEAVANEITGDMLHDKAENFVVCLQ
jgi:hypothetical protein